MFFCVFRKMCTMSASIIYPSDIFFEKIIIRNNINFGYQQITQPSKPSSRIILTKVGIITIEVKYRKLATSRSCKIIESWQFEIHVKIIESWKSSCHYIFFFLS